MALPRPPYAPVAVALALAVSGCRADLTVSPPAAISCASGACPEGWTCNRKLDRCIWNGAIDTVAPAVVGTVAISPALARAGAFVTVGFEVSEPLRRDPAVTLRAGAGRPLWLLERDGLRYVYGYFVTGTELAGADLGDAAVSIALEDLQAVEGTASGGVVTFDFRPPKLDASLLAGSPARAGAPLTLTFTVSEPLGAEPVVRLADGSPLSRQAFDGDRTYVYGYVTAGSEPEGAPGQQVLVSLTDRAGNVAEGLPAGAAVFDFHGPQLEGFTLSGSPARAGAPLSLTLRVSERLGADPVVRLPAGQRFTRRSHDGDRTYVLGYDTAGEGTEPEGVAQQALATLVDVAGNVTEDVPCGSAVFDFHPPAVTAAALTGSPARHGATVLLQLVVSEPLAGDPAVRFGMGPLAFARRSVDDATRTYVYAYDAAGPGTEPEGDAQPVFVTLADPAGNVAPNLPVGSAVFDFHPPALVVPAILDGSPARAGADVTVTLCVSEPLALDPDVRFVDGTPFRPAGTSGHACPGSSAGRHVYAYTATSGEDETAPRQVLVRLVDLAWNASDALPGGAPWFDLTPPALSAATMDPAVAAKGGDDVVLTFTASEPLGAVPAVVFEPEAGGTPIVFTRVTPALEPPRYSFHHLANPATDGQATGAFSLTLVDAAGNVAAGLAGPAYALIFTSPNIDDLKTCRWASVTEPLPCDLEERVFSGQPGFDDMKVTFSLPETPARVEVRMGDQEVGGYDPVRAPALFGKCWASADRRAWRCRQAVVGAFGTEETRTLRVTVWNAARASSSQNVSVTYDNLPPSVDFTTTMLQRCDDYPPARPASLGFSWLKPVHAIAGPRCPYDDPPCDGAGTARVSITALDPLGLDTVRTPGCDRAVERCVPAAAVFLHQAGRPGDVPLRTGRCHLPDPRAAIAFIDAVPAAGTWEVFARLTDEHGNTSDTLVGHFVYDDAPPPAVDTAAPDPVAGGRVTYVRAPAGRTEGARDPVRQVVGLPGAVAPGAPGAQVSAVLLLGPEAASTVAGCVVAGARAPRVAASVDGAFTCDVPEDATSPFLWIAQEDPAGNRSAPALVRWGEWTAKAAGANRLVRQPYWPLARDTAEVLPQLDPPFPVVTEGAPRFERAARPADPIPERAGHCAATWSPELGKVVMVGGHRRRGGVLEFSAGTAAWDGRRWELWPLSPAPSARASAALTHDRARGRTVLFGGRDTGDLVLGDTWELDAGGWRKVHDQASSSAGPPPRRGAALFWDAAARAVWLYGGVAREREGLRASAGMWSWDGVRWTERDPARLRPDARAFPLVATDPASGRTLLASGTAGTNESDDPIHGENGTVWAWSGGVWTRHAGASPTLDHRRAQLWFDGGLRTFLLHTPEDGTLHAWQDAPPGFVARSALGRDDALVRGEHGPCGAYDEDRGAFVRFGGCRFPDRDMAALCDVSAAPPQAEQATFAFASGAWGQRSPVPAAPPARSGAALAWDPGAAASTAFLWGGSTDPSPAGTSDAWRWDGWRWTAVGSVGDAGLEGAALAAWDPSSGVTARLVRYGGTGPASAGAALSTFVLDGSAWAPGCGATCGEPGAYLEPVPAGSLDALGGEQSIVFLEDGGGAALLFFRGEKYVPSEADPAVVDTRSTTWLATFDPAGSGSVVWTPAPDEDLSGATVAPATGSGHRLSWCPTEAGPGVVLFGGTVSAGAGAPVYQDRTWVWTRAGGWADATPGGSPSPPPRARHVQFCDAATRHVVIVGGVGPGGALDDVWAWDGTRWTEWTPLAGPRPPARAGAAGIAGGPGVAPFLFGGAGAAGARLDDTWVWSGGGDARPAHVLSVRFAEADVDPSLLGSLVLTWRGGASSRVAAGPGAATVAGTSLHLWRDGAWRAAGASGEGTFTAAGGGGSPAAPATATWSITSAVDLAPYFTGPDRTLTAAWVPLGVNGVARAVVASEHAQLRVIYRLCVSGGPAAHDAECCTGARDAGGRCP